MKTIDFKQRQILLDDFDYDFIVATMREGYHLCVINHRYVGFTIDRTGVTLHDMILGQAPIGLVTDHIDRNTYNNQRQNLRHVTHAQNAQNSGMRKSNRLGYKGITVSQHGYAAEIIIDGQRYWRGRYPTPKEAAVEYDKMAAQYGSYAPTNASLGLL